MTDDFKLNARAKKWLTAIRGMYKTGAPDAVEAQKAKVAGFGAFKLM
jgi:hypothetical protein